MMEGLLILKIEKQLIKISLFYSSLIFFFNFNKNENLIKLVEI